MNNDHHVILRVISKMLIPVIVMFGFYTQFHGDFGPGGGFQAGIIIAVGVILYALEYQALFQEPPGEHHGQHVGIILIELGVLFAVTGAMLTIFYAFAGRVAEIRDKDW